MEIPIFPTPLMNLLSINTGEISEYLKKQQEYARRVYAEALREDRDVPADASGVDDRPKDQEAAEGQPTKVLQLTLELRRGGVSLSWSPSRSA